MNEEEEKAKRRAEERMTNDWQNDSVVKTELTNKLLCEF